MDLQYWEDYYKKQSSNRLPSNFANFVCENYLDSRTNFLELGCGNGRDSIFFANKGLTVEGVDQVKIQIQALNNQFELINNLTFTADDFTSLKREKKYDIIYSRFTLHSIPIEKQHKVLKWSFSQLSTNGVLCIEVRGKKNEIYQKGASVQGEKDAFIYDDHYRRFLDFEDLKVELKDVGFEIVYSDEAKGFAPFNGLDETFIRVIAHKK